MPITPRLMESELAYLGVEQEVVQLLALACLAGL